MVVTVTAREPWPPVAAVRSVCHGSLPALVERHLKVEQVLAAGGFAEAGEVKRRAALPGGAEVEEAAGGVVGREHARGEGAAIGGFNRNRIGERVELNPRAAGIKDEAVLVGLLDRFEIWNLARYENVKVADAVLASEAFKLME